MVYLLDTNAISDLMRGLPQIENWMAGLERADHVVTCPIVRGEILFGSHASRRADGARNWRREGRFLDALHCEPVPERAGDLYAAVKLGRQQRGLAMDENDLWVAATASALGATLVSRGDFGGIEGLAVVAVT